MESLNSKTVTNAVTALKEEATKLQDEKLMAEYSRIRNKVSRDVKNDQKKEYYKHQFQDLNISPKTWTVIHYLEASPLYTDVFMRLIVLSQSKSAFTLFSNVHICFCLHPNIALAIQAHYPQCFFNVSIYLF